MPLFTTMDEDSLRRKVEALFSAQQSRKCNFARAEQELKTNEAGKLIGFNWKFKIERGVKEFAGWQERCNEAAEFWNKAVAAAEAIPGYVVQKRSKVGPYKASWQFTVKAAKGVEPQPQTVQAFQALFELLNS